MFRFTLKYVNQMRPSRSTIPGLLAAAGVTLAPPQCVLCGRPGLPGPIDLCAACLAELPSAAHDPPSGSAAYVLVCCPWAYDYPVADLVRQLKYSGERAHGRLLGTLLARERARHGAPLPDCVVPVPLHARRLRERGYNQAAELARYAARALALRCRVTALQRLRATREQTALHAAERAANTRHAFTARHALDGLRVALVDDVITTGSTAAAAAAALRAAGVAEKELWVVARAVRRLKVSP